MTHSEAIPSDVHRPTISAWGAGFVAVSVMLTRSDHYYARPALAVASLALAAAFLTFGQRNTKFLTGLLSSILIVVAAWLSTELVDRLLAAWEARLPSFALYSHVSAAFLGLRGELAGATDGVLNAVHSDGMLAIRPSMEKVGLRWTVATFVAWHIMLFCQRRAITAPKALVAIAIFGLVSCARYIVLLLLYVESDNILSLYSGHLGLSLLWNPYVNAVYAMFLSVLAGRLVKHDSLARTNGHGWRLYPFVVALSFLAACGATFLPKGPEKAGRVLIDDRLCGQWEPTARLLDEKWYGDYATYSFTSVAEWLGHFYMVDVNTSKEYDDELLSGYDVLIVKTPEEWITEDEHAAIRRFVEGGGGLLLVGDHTNLLGMSGRLNSLSEPYGISFRYDAVGTYYSGGFNRYNAPLIGRHPAAADVNSLLFMTSCSLDINGKAEPVLTLGDCKKDPHDYSRGSYFGQQRSYPDTEYGRAVLAAVADCGEGRIGAFTDSTVWSSFAVFKHDREKLALGLVAHLNRRTHPACWIIRVGGIACTLGLLALIWIHPRRQLALALALASAWCGLALVEREHRLVYAAPQPRQPIHEISFLWEGGYCAFPPTLGSLGNLSATQAFDTLFVTTQRLGFVPRIAWEFETVLSPSTRAVVLVAPVDQPPVKVLNELKEAVQGGVHLLIMDSGGSSACVDKYLRLFDADARRYLSGGRPQLELQGMTEVKLPDPGTFAAVKRHGLGSVVYLNPAESFSREKMGHCFIKPGMGAAGRYETVYMILRECCRDAPNNRRYYGIL